MDLGVVEVGVQEVQQAQFAGKVELLSIPPQGEELSLQQQEQLQALLIKWQGVFSTNEEDFGQTDIVQHQIPTGDVPPI